MQITISIHDASNPVDEVHVILCLESVTDGPIDLSFFRSFKLFKKSKTTRNLRHGCGKRNTSWVKILYHDCKSKPQRHATETHTRTHTTRRGLIDPQILLSHLSCWKHTATAVRHTAKKRKERVFRTNSFSYSLFLSNSLSHGHALLSNDRHSLDLVKQREKTLQTYLSLNISSRTDIEDYPLCSMNVQVLFTLTLTRLRRSLQKPFFFGNVSVAVGLERTKRWTVLLLTYGRTSRFLVSSCAEIQAKTDEAKTKKPTAPLSQRVFPSKIERWVSSKRYVQ